MGTQLDLEKLKELIKFYPHPAQQEVLENQKRFTVLCAGRRAGKTRMVSYLALRELFCSDRIIWVVAPQYGLAEKVWNCVLPICYGQGKQFRIDRNKMRIENRASNSRLELKSAENPQALLGEGIDLLIMDEAANVPKNIYYQYLRPTLTDRLGSAVFISTPDGSNWFKDLANQAEREYKAKGEESEYIYFHFSSYANPHIPKEDLEESKRTMPEMIYRSQILAEFIADGGKVFRNIEACVLRPPTDPKERALWDKKEKEEESKLVNNKFRYIIGVDLGRAEDFTVIMVVDRFRRRVVEIERIKEVSWPAQKIRIQSMAKKYNAPITIDATGLGAPISEDLKREQLNVTEFVYTTQSKKQLIENLMIALEQQQIQFPNHAQLLHELEVFGYEISNSGNMIYSAPGGEHDDCVNALALALWTCGPYIKTGVSQKTSKPLTLKIY